MTLIKKCRHKLKEIFQIKALRHLHSALRVTLRTNKFNLQIKTGQPLN